MSRVERLARAAVITTIGMGAGWISLMHVYAFVMGYTPPGTHWSTGVIVAGVSELMPLGVALNARNTGRLGGLAVFLLLLAGVFSLLAQIVTADPTTFGYIVASFPTLAFMGLVKLMLGKRGEVKAQPEQRAVELLGLGQATRGEVAAQPATLGEREGELEVVPGPAATTGEEAAGPGLDATPTPATGPKRSGDKRPRRSASRVETAEKVRLARVELEQELGRKATQAEVGVRAGCSAATVSRAESRPQLSLAA
ncbi:hypothetical protein FHR83_007494 [Actinoplanes campanulatus]|uniref:Uncharacterized protein n=1 Tax=Actinoplanes campanulatus TaxID=113559 RepID=A0A7W5AP35_9ACTN|nr:hypothetical protein [Actinoplanes campanulatus]MBB3099778.1 hypothetical protein [Actinoplanes campanulatus]GGN47082.1 hypothetical protein GCM10010109_82960 [Actinoplanes campanulatus]GID42349.1 hypothetical protein Aca09nite_88550 [Actinoplanes campanulatus]